MEKEMSYKRFYHKLIDIEFRKYQEDQSFANVFLTRKDLDDSETTKSAIEWLLDNEFLIQLEDGKYRTLHMDLACRSSDVRVKHKGSRYILENSLQVRKRPLLSHDYARFENSDSLFSKFFAEIIRKIGNNKSANALIRGLKDFGIEGLSKYQYDSIMTALSSEKDAVISAPTGFGKTYVFLIPALVEAVCGVERGLKGTKAVFFYPRNSLGSDQLNRLIQILYYINCRLKGNLRLGIDIGPAGKLEEGRTFFGTKCPVHQKHLVIQKQNVHCPEGHTMDFVQLRTKNIRQIRQDPPDLLISNIWTWEYRLTKQAYWNSNYLNKNIKYLIFDEIHGYRGIVAGVLRYFIRILLKLVSPNARVFLSSATIPHLEQFTEEILNKSPSEIINLVYDEDKHGKDDQKLELYLLAGVSPFRSWETYTHELAIFLSTVNRLKKTKNVQSLFFVDSIKNINRLYSQTQQAIDLGDPQDHLGEEVPGTDPYCYWVYNRNYKFRNSEIPSEPIKRLQSKIKDNVEVHYSYRSDAHEIEDKIREGNIDIVYSTSTLELGVDYDTAAVVVNAGVPFNLESIPQRVGRAGRQKTTLNTSLSIILVRNNPLEYFYLYKGIDQLTDVSKMAPIPVSYQNHFVILYSALLYIASLLIKNDQKLTGNIDDVAYILDYLEENEFEIMSDLGTDENIQKAKDDVIQLLSILQEEDMENTCECVESYFNRTWLYKQVRYVIQDTESLITSIQEEMNEVPSRDKTGIQKSLNSLSQILNSRSDSKDLKQIESFLFKLDGVFSKLRDHIRGISHPLFSYRSEIGAISRNKIDKSLNLMSELEEVSDNLERFEGIHNLYARACEIYRDIKSVRHLVRFIETLIGFRYMGNEFIDKEVDVSTENALKSSQESLSNFIFRVPPFEVQNIPFESADERDITKIVGGRYTWLIKPRSYYVLDPGKEAWSIRDKLQDTGIAKGQTIKYRDLLIPDRIKLLDFLSREPFTLKIWGRGGKGKTRIFYLKYGSRELVNSKIKNSYNIKGNVRRLATMNRNDQYKYIKTVTEKKLNQVNDNLEQQGNPWGVNLDYIAVCKLGRAISTDPFSLRCPPEIVEDCGLCDGKKFWQPYRKMFPKVYLNQKVRNIPPVEHPLVLKLDTTTYDELKESVEFVYDTAQFSFSAGFAYFQREFDIEPLGYQAKTSFITVQFNPTFINALIEVILKENPDLIELLKYKYYMYQKFEEEGHTADVAPYVLRFDSSKIDISSPEFEQFVKDSLIHTLGHLLYIYIATTIGVDTTRLTLHLEKQKIFIFENSKKDGMGIVETIRDRLSREGLKDVFSNFVNETSTFLATHDHSVNELEDELRDENSQNLDQLKEKNRNIAQLHKTMKSLNEELNNHVNPNFIDYTTYRYLLLKELKSGEEVAEYFLPIIHAQGFPSLCYDGCNDCIIMKHNCSIPFGQPYLLSKRLATKFFDYFKKGSISIVARGVGAYIEEFMQDAEKITVKSPYVDQYGFELLKRMKNNSKDVVLITKKGSANLCKKLKELGVKVKLAEDFHNKVYYLEGSNYSLLIHGSVNLQRKGFKINEESVTISWDPSEISSFIDKIEGFE